MRNYNSQLKSVITNSMIASAGGAVLVTNANDTALLSITDADGVALSNPLTLTNGSFDFNVVDSIASVDLYIQSPTGHFIVVTDLKSSGDASIFVDTSQVLTTMVIPFDIADTTAATETDTGFNLIDNSQVLPVGLAIDVNTLDATETIDVGILSTESGGDANGFMSLVSVATADTIIAKTTVTTGSNEVFLASTTIGALVNDFNAGTDVATDVGVSMLKSHVCDGTAVSISYTLTAGTDTAAGFIKIPVILPVASL